MVELQEGEGVLLKYGVKMVEVLEEEDSEFEEEKQKVAYSTLPGRQKVAYTTLPGGVDVRTAYKRKKEKVRPVDQPHQHGTIPEEKEEWKLPLTSGRIVDWGYFNGNLIPKFSNIPRGSRLTAERIQSLRIGEDLTKEERSILLEILHNREEAIAFDFSEKGVVKEEVEEPHKIPTIDHKAWQAPGFRVPKGLREEVREIVEDRLKAGTVERS